MELNRFQAAGTSSVRPEAPDDPIEPRLREPSPEVGDALGAVVETCLKRLRRWQAPPNWAFGDWMKEMACQGHAAAWEALGHYDPTRGLSPAAFVMCRVMARCLTRYRQEWAFAGRCEGLASEGGDPGEAEDRRYPPQLEGSIWEYEDLVQAVSQLKELDRWILKQLFWEERREGDVAEELGVSQPAVSKRKRTILGKLRRLLSGSKRAAGWTPKPGAETAPLR